MDYFMIDEAMDKQIRYNFFYGLGNMAVVFRSCLPGRAMPDSRDGKILFQFDHECSSTIDFLSYLLAVYETGQIVLCREDVVSIKINGTIMSYRCVMRGRERGFKLWDFFAEHENFEVNEKQECVEQMHRQNHVLDVLSGREIGMESICLPDTVICAIDKEFYFPKGNRNGLVVTDYFLYELKEMQIRNINPHQRPFCDIRSALMFFKHSRELQKDRYKNRLLLLDKQELYLLRDYSRLMMAL